MYPFRMHYYGPYSDELDRVLSLARSVGIIDIKPDPDGFGYHVTPIAESASSWLQEYDISEDPNIAQIDETIRVLGSIETSKLELYATIHFIDRKEGEQSKDQTLKIVKRLKPKFTDTEIEHAYQTLRETSLI